MACLLVLIGIVSVFGQSRLNSESASVQEVSLIRTNVLELDRELQNLRINVDRFVALGNDSIPGEVNRIENRIFDRIDSLELGEDSEMKSKFERIKSHLAKYFDHFDSVVAERQIREKLVSRELPERAQSAETRIRKLLDSDSRGSTSNRSPSSSLNLTQCLTELSQAEKSFLRYFESPESKYVADANRKLESAIERVNSTNLETSEKQELVRSLEEFGATGMRAVQATRSYLFFRNVVMSGEQSEVTYFATNLRELTTEKHATSRARVRSTQSTVGWITLATVITALTMAVLIGGRIIYLTIPPITALTKTFDSLSKGESLVEIPGVDRPDEIGRMAKSARVFSNQNQNTRELLAKSQVLSEKLAIKAEELDSFAYVASHDLKSPLRGIRQLATWIEEDSMESLPEKSVTHLQHLRSRVAKMEQLLQDLLDFSRVGRIDAKSEEVHLGDMIEGVIELTDNPAGVKIAVPDDLPTISTVRSPLEQVLLNLIGNAIKHNDKGADGLVTIEWKRRGDKLAFFIQDNGPGIAESNHERVFQMYQRVGTGNVEGSGMGLAIVKKQIQRMGGQIMLKSEISEGSRFEFTWPVKVAASSSNDNVVQQT